MKVIDQFADPTCKHLHRVFNAFPETEYLIKNATISTDENEKRADSAFAWQDQRLFPIDSPEQAAVSRLYMEFQDVPDYVKTACEKALRVYGIEMPIRVEKTAQAESDPDEYLLPQQRRFRVRSGDDVKLAADALLRNRRGMDVVTRATAAMNLVKKSIHHQVRVPDRVLKMAGYTMSQMSPLADWLEARAELTKDETVKTAFLKLAEVARQNPKQLSGDRDDLVKFADTVSELDSTAGLQHLYDREIPDPLETVFNTTKIADDILELAGRQVPLAELLSIDPEAYRDIFGEDVADEFIEDGEIIPEQLRIILPTVPYDLQKVLAAQQGY
jgi:hypothetical protein